MVVVVYCEIVVSSQPVVYSSFVLLVSLQCLNQLLLMTCCLSIAQLFPLLKVLVLY